MLEPEDDYDVEVMQVGGRSEGGGLSKGMF
jgi:hypothetical protein